MHIAAAGLLLVVGQQVHSVFGTTEGTKEQIGSFTHAQKAFSQCLLKQSLYTRFISTATATPL